jgi:hypothetical protein
VKTKHRGHVQVVQDGNDKVTMRDNVFQNHELIDTYRVTLSTNLEENSNFYIVENIFLFDIDVGELNNILKINEHIEVNKDKDTNEYQFNKKIMIDITMMKLMKKKIILIKLLNTDETFIVVVLLL